ncbi:hypothetical protein HNR42_002841 [Deinobacterium chartae]|uniref:Uncharacterized protein n=1 Tax=Deinobacterium chartae TaxID=521158 RepID=A0A841I4Q1_9DEIO|nr:hypothetical protein [Deinobacterium chartae]MBB6099400.1 hypothetical protein [Deinobacterium chartae]
MKASDWVLPLLGVTAGLLLVWAVTGFRIPLWQLALAVALVGACLLLGRVGPRGKLGR